MESELDLDQIRMDWPGLDLVETCFVLLYDRRIGAVRLLLWKICTICTAI